MKIAFDIGNGFCCSYFKEQNLDRIAAIESIFAPVNGVKLQSTLESPIVGFSNVTYHLGEKATFYPYFSRVSDGSKAKAAKLFLLPLLPYPNEEYEIVTALPGGEASPMAGELVKELSGTHKYTIDGTGHRVTVDSVKILPEGYGAYLANRNRLTAGGYTLVVDIGFRTVSSLLIDSRTLEPAMSFVFDQGGVMSLVNDVTDDQFPDPGIVQQGITSQSLTYGLTGESFKERLEAVRPTWQIFLNNLVKGKYLKLFQRGQITSVLYTGGGALLLDLQEKDSPFRVRKATNPLHDNVIGYYV